MVRHPVTTLVLYRQEKDRHKSMMN